MTKMLREPLDVPLTVILSSGTDMTHAHVSSRAIKKFFDCRRSVLFVSLPLPPPRLSTLPRAHLYSRWKHLSSCSCATDTFGAEFNWIAILWGETGVQSRRAHEFLLQARMPLSFEKKVIEKKIRMWCVFLNCSQTHLWQPAADGSRCQRSQPTDRRLLSSPLPPSAHLIHLEV